MDRADGPLAEDPHARHSAFTNAVCLDLPYILDSVWRHAEYDANSLFSYRIAHDAAGKLAVSLTRRYTASPASWLFLLTLVCVAYGATFDAWCSVVGAAGMHGTRLALEVLTMCGAAYAWWLLGRYGKQRAEKRFNKAKPPVLETEYWRRRFVHCGVQAAILCLVGGGIYARLVPVAAAAHRSLSCGALARARAAAVAGARRGSGVVLPVEPAIHERALADCVAQSCCSAWPRCFGA